MAKAVYTPVSIIFSVIGGIAAGAIFKQIWKLVSDEEDSPKALESEYGWKEILPAAALQGAIFAVVKAVIQRSGARGFQGLTGAWPGD